MKNRLLIRFWAWPEQKNANDEIPVYCYLRLRGKEHILITPYSITSTTYSKYIKNEQKLIDDLYHLVAELKGKIANISYDLSFKNKSVTLDQIIKELEEIKFAIGLIV